MGQSYRDLVVWHKAMELVMEIYRLTQTFPKEEIFGLLSQLRRAAVSIPSNIAEGQGTANQRRIPGFFRKRQRVTFRIGNPNPYCSETELS